MDPYGALITNIERFITLTEEERDYFISILRVTTVRKKQYICQPEFVCRYRSYVFGGSLRSYFVDAGATLTEGIAALDLPEEFGARMIAGTPLGRLGLPEDIARVAVFLASDDAAWVTGERVTVSGGYK